MGIKGSSTRTVYFDNVQVPVENVLGEIGKGYKIAFNILNIGRLKLGAGAAGGARSALNLAAKYSDERKAFGRPLHGFGMIKKKLAYMSADVYAAEALAFRTIGMVEEARVAAGEDRMAQLAAIEEYAIECSMPRSTDPKRSAAAWTRASRSSAATASWKSIQSHTPTATLASIASLKAPTRLIAWLPPVRSSSARWRAASTSWPLCPQIQSEVTGGKVSDFATGDTRVALRESVNLVERAKRAALFSIMAAATKFAANIREEQEFLEAAANQIIALFAADSAVARALDAARDGNADVHTHELLAQIAVLRLLPETRAAIESVLTMGFDGDERRQQHRHRPCLPRRRRDQHRAAPARAGRHRRREPAAC